MPHHLSDIFSGLLFVLFILDTKSVLVYSAEEQHV